MGYAFRARMGYFCNQGFGESDDKMGYASIKAQDLSSPHFNCTRIARSTRKLFSPISRLSSRTTLLAGEFGRANE